MCGEKLMTNNIEILWRQIESLHNLNGFEFDNIELHGLRFDKEGIVEFKAKYIDMATGEEIIHHERSYFVKKGRHWYYKGWLPIK